MIREILRILMYIRGVQRERDWEGERERGREREGERERERGGERGGKREGGRREREGGEREGERGYHYMMQFQYLSTSIRWTIVIH